MRLTLRTLLAYLDDTLEPAQAKLIGQKVAESDTARELIERIKQVTRRRRLTAPPTAGPGGNIDPNTIAEYLDNEVTPEQSTEVEQICLASDVHLAEVAACHQILTLVLGEPALVPPSAKKRMYGLVKGQEAIQSRKPPRTNLHPELDQPENQEMDETLRMGLPPFRQSGDLKQRLFLWGGGALAALLLVIAMWQILGGRDDDDGPGPQALQPTTTTDRKTTSRKKAIQTPDKKDKKTVEPVVDPKENDKKPKDNKEKDPKETEPKDKEQDPNEKKVKPKQKDRFEPIFLDVASAAPSSAVAPIAALVPQRDKSPSLAVQKGDAAWSVVDPKMGKFVSGRPLVGLPGFKSSMETETGVGLTLWGIMRELWPSVDPLGVRLYESAVVLHQHGQLDLDLTLRRGRIVLTSNRDDRPARVRLRYHNPTLRDKLQHVDISLLDKDASIVIERSSLPYFLTSYETLWKDPQHPNRTGPSANLAFIAISGRVHIKANNQPPAFPLEAPPGDAQMVWNSLRGRYDEPIPLKEIPPFLLPAKAGDNPVRAAMLKARDDLYTRLIGKKVDLDYALTEILANAVKEETRDPLLARLCVRARGALDNLPELLELLPHQDKDVRRSAIQALENWIVQDRDNDHKLWLAVKTRYPKEGEKIMEILHGLGFAFTNVELLNDYVMTSPSVILREMAQIRLEDLDMLRKLIAAKKKG